MSKSNNLTKSIYTYEDVMKHYGFNPDDIFKKQGIELNDSKEDVDTCIKTRHDNYLITRMNIGYMNVDCSSTDKVTMCKLIRYTIDILNE